MSRSLIIFDKKDIRWWLYCFHNNLQLQAGGSTLTIRTALELCEELWSLGSKIKEHQRQILLILEFHMKPGLSIRQNHYGLTLICNYSIFKIHSIQRPRRVRRNREDTNIRYKLWHKVHIICFGIMRYKYKLYNRAKVKELLKNWNSNSYKLNVCFSLKFICWNLLSNVMLFGGRAFGRWLDQDLAALKDGISILMRPETMCMYREGRTYNFKRVLTRTGPFWLLDL